MTTDLYIFLSHSDYSKTMLELDTANIIKQLEQFEQNYSRFLPNNRLSKFNDSEEFTIDNEFFEILELCKKYHTNTQGLFDPCIHDDIVRLGYEVSKDKGFVYHKNLKDHSSYIHEYSFNQIAFNKNNNRVRKPKNLKLDLGGIGKGYIINKISKELKKIYPDFCLSLGGDMYCHGNDIKNQYPYWAIEVANPFDEYIDTPTLLIKNRAVATSGIYKRKWIKNGKEYHHIINPKTRESTDNNIVSVSVISSNVIDSDVYSKVLIIMGLEKALYYCENNNIAAIFILKDKYVVTSKKAQEYVWKD